MVLPPIGVTAPFSDPLWAGLVDIAEGDGYKLIPNPAANQKVWLRFKWDQTQPEAFKPLWGPPSTLKTGLDAYNVATDPWEKLGAVASLWQPLREACAQHIFWGRGGWADLAHGIFRQKMYGSGLASLTTLLAQAAAPGSTLDIARLGAARLWGYRLEYPDTASLAPLPSAHDLAEFLKTLPEHQANAAAAVLVTDRILNIYWQSHLKRALEQIEPHPAAAAVRARVGRTTPREALGIALGPSLAERATEEDPVRLYLLGDDDLPVLYGVAESAAVGAVLNLWSCGLWTP